MFHATCGSVLTVKKRTQIFGQTPGLLHGQSIGFLTRYPWAFNDLPMGCHHQPMGIPWASLGQPMRNPCMGNPWAQLMREFKLRTMCCSTAIVTVAQAEGSKIIPAKDPHFMKG